MIKAIIFDLDNTLIDFMTMKKMSVAGAIRAMQDAGLKISYKKSEKILYELYDKYGIEYQEIFQAFLRKTLGKIDYRILANAVVGYRKVERGFMRPYPKVRSTLMKLQNKGITLAILTDAPRMRAWLRLAEMDLAEFFDYVVTFDDTKVKKPAKKPFQFILRKLKLNPGDVMVVGDSLEKDIAGAKSVGMKTCYAEYGEMYPEKVKKVVKPDYIIKSIDKLINICFKDE